MISDHITVSLDLKDAKSKFISNLSKSSNWQSKSDLNKQDFTNFDNSRSQKIKMVKLIYPLRLKVQFPTQGILKAAGHLYFMMLIYIHHLQAE